MSSLSVTYASESDAPKWLRHYVVGRQIGEGCYGKVKEAYDVLSRRRVAVKIIKSVVVRKIRGGEAAVQRELNILQRLRGERHVLHFIESWFDSDKSKTYLVTRFVDGESLASLVARVERLAAPQCWHYFRQLFVAIECLQRHQIAHRDIKPDNVMLSAAHHQVTLIDFGVALVVGEHDASSAATGSQAYQPPEKMTDFDTASDFDADVWAAGLCLYQACTGVHPFEACMPSVMFDRIARADIDFALVDDKPLLGLLHKLLARDPKQRCSARTARKYAAAQLAVVPRRTRKQFEPLAKPRTSYDVDELRRHGRDYRAANNLSDRSVDELALDSDGGGNGTGVASDDDWQPSSHGGGGGGSSSSLRHHRVASPRPTSLRPMSPRSPRALRASPLRASPLRSTQPPSLEASPAIVAPSPALLSSAPDEVVSAATDDDTDHEQQRAREQPVIVIRSANSNNSNNNNNNNNNTLSSSGSGRKKPQCVIQ